MSYQAAMNAAFEIKHARNKRAAVLVWARAVKAMLKINAGREASRSSDSSPLDPLAPSMGLMKGL